MTTQTSHDGPAAPPAESQPITLDATKAVEVQSDEHKAVEVRRGSAVVAATGQAHRWLRAQTESAAAELRFSSTRPPALVDHIAYARSGEWTDAEADSRSRHLALAWAHAVAIPVSVIAYLVVWVVARPGRCASFLAVTLLLNTALDAIPVIGWFIPEWATLPFWPPFSWIF